MAPVGRGLSLGRAHPLGSLLPPCVRQDGQMRCLQRATESRARLEMNAARKISLSQILLLAR